jgi:hypothetical protein
MPPIQPSLRGSLLTGASALALSLSASGARGQAPNPIWQVWAEGAKFWTGGGGMNVPGLTTLKGFPGTAFSIGPPGPAWEGAFGFDYRWPTTPWHAVFDVRYGKTGTVNKGAFFFFSITRPFFTSTLTNSQSAQEHGSHFVADFMIGRDYGLGGGTGTGQIQFGLRVADLRATVNELQFARGTFYSGGPIFQLTQTAAGTWSSRFFGVGPRLAVAQSMSLGGLWTFDFAGGIAGLVGDRSLNVAVTVTPGNGFFANHSTLDFIFNADGWAGLTFAFAPNYKVTGGIRADYYNNALSTVNSTVSRVFWGPFIRLTGHF